MGAAVSSRARCGPVAQLVEQLTFNQWVTGSNPVGRTKVLRYLERFPSAPKQAGTRLGQAGAANSPPPPTQHQQPKLSESNSSQGTVTGLRPVVADLNAGEG